MGNVFATLRAIVAISVSSKRGCWTATKRPRTSKVESLDAPFVQNVSAARINWAGIWRFICTLKTLFVSIVEGVCSENLDGKTYRRSSSQNKITQLSYLRKKNSDPGPKPLYWYCTSDPWRSVLVTCHLGLKVYSFHFWSLLKWSHCTSPHLQACVSLLIILEAPWKGSLEGFIDSPTANSTKVIKYFAIDVLIEASSMSKKSCYNTLWRWTRGDKKGGVNVLAEYCYPWNILAT